MSTIDRCLPSSGLVTWWNCRSSMDIIRNFIIGLRKSDVVSRYYTYTWLVNKSPSSIGLTFMRPRLNHWLLDVFLWPAVPHWNTAMIVTAYRFWSVFVTHAANDIFFWGAAAQRWPWPPHSWWGFLITLNDAPQSVGLLWTSDQLVAETSTWQHTTLTTDKHSCPRWHSNPQSQQASGRRTTPSTARPLGPASK